MFGKLTFFYYCIQITIPKVGIIWSFIFRFFVAASPNSPHWICESNRRNNTEVQIISDWHDWTNPKLRTEP